MKTDTTQTTDRKPQLAVERSRNKVTLEIYCQDDYAAMLLYEQITTSTAAIGETFSFNRSEGRRLCMADKPESYTTVWHLIEIAFDDLDERDRAYEAIEKLLGDMGQIGTLSARTERANAK